jgi:hypothetical protein
MGFAAWYVREERRPATTHRENAMRKLALNADTLRVESFATQEAQPVRGTVRGHDDTIETENCTIDNEYTCWLATCPTFKGCRAARYDDAARNR